MSVYAAVVEGMGPGTQVGLFAKQDFARGQQITTEIPLVSVRHISADSDMVLAPKINEAFGAEHKDLTHPASKLVAELLVNWEKVKAMFTGKWWLKKQGMRAGDELWALNALIAVLRKKENEPKGIMKEIADAHPEQAKNQKMKPCALEREIAMVSIKFNQIPPEETGLMTKVKSGDEEKEMPMGGIEFTRRLYELVLHAHFPVITPVSGVVVAHHLYNAMSYLNHSCAPNACVYLTQAGASLVAHREIKEGEEITIAYEEECLLGWDGTKTKETSPFHLQLNNVLCQCGKCWDIARLNGATDLTDNKGKAAFSRLGLGITECKEGKFATAAKTMSDVMSNPRYRNAMKGATSMSRLLGARYTCLALMMAGNLRPDQPAREKVKKMSEMIKKTAQELKEEQILGIVENRSLMLAFLSEIWYKGTEFYATMRRQEAQGIPLEEIKLDTSSFHLTYAKVMGGLSLMTCIDIQELAEFICLTENVLSPIIRYFPGLFAWSSDQGMRPVGIDAMVSQADTQTEESQDQEGQAPGSGNTEKGKEAETNQQASPVKTESE